MRPVTEDGTVVRKSDGDGVEIVSLRNPPVNAPSARLLSELGVVLEGLEAMGEMRAVVLTGDGACFSAGADLKELTNLDEAQARSLVATGRQRFARISGLSAPVLAAVNGPAVGGGLELALSCDLPICGGGAKFGAPEVNFGPIPAYGGTQRLSRLIGPAEARELIFTGGMIPAAEALRIGLVNTIVHAGQELRAARDLAHKIAQRAPGAVVAIKRAFAAGVDRPIEAGWAIETPEFLENVLPTQDLKEGISAFMEHRPPKFRGA